MTKEWDGHLSYSSYREFMQCKRKYLHRKVLETPIDSDSVEDTYNLRYGSCLHALLERTMHDVTKVTVDLIKSCCNEYELEFDSDGARLIAALRHYKKLRDKSGLQVIAVETHVTTPEFDGYIDCTLSDSVGNWWMGDLKTAASPNQFTYAKLNSDWQLNLYAYHAPEVAGLLNLDLNKWMGMTYIVALKSKIKRGLKEGFKEYASRVEGSTKVMEFYIDRKSLQINPTYEGFKARRKEIERLYKLKPAASLKHAEPNFEYCSSFYKPCEYWSQCHGCNFSEAKNHVLESV